MFIKFNEMLINVKYYDFRLSGDLAIEIQSVFYKHVYTLTFNNKEARDEKFAELENKLLGES